MKIWNSCQGWLNSNMPSCERTTLFIVIGFQSLNGVGERGVTSPVAANTARFTATHAQLTDQVMQRLEATAVRLKR